MTQSWKLSTVPTISKNVQVQIDATNLDAWASDSEDGPDVVNGVRNTETASYPTNCQAQAMQVPEHTMAIALPSVPPTLVSKGTQTLQWKANRPTLTARQVLANEAHSTRYAGADSSASGKPLRHMNHQSTERPGAAVVEASKAQQQKQQINSHQASSQNKDSNLPDQGLQYQVQHQNQQKLTALQTEKDLQLAECWQLREDLQHQLQYIQQTLTQLDDKEAHLKLQFQAVVQKFENQKAPLDVRTCSKKPNSVQNKLRQ